MKFCQPHWDELRKAIDDRGLSHLVASSGEAAMERAVSEIEGKDTLANYDPLMNAHWMICGCALEVGGLYLMTGEYCPLCELDKHAKNDDGTIPAILPSKQWIDGCTDSVRDYCIEQGLKPKGHSHA